jgi:hypothetical protein
VAISNHPVLTPLESELRFGRYDPGRHLLSREHWRIERDAALSIVDDPYLGLRFSADALDRLKGVQPPAWVSIRLHPWKQVRRLVFRLEDVGIGEAIVPPGADRVDTSLALPSEALSPWRWTPLFMSLAWTSGEAESEPVFRLCRFAQQTQPLAGPRLSKHFDDPAYRLRRRLSGRG